jgi:AbrB family looped-hinge helix DNA binding protein
MAGKTSATIKEPIGRVGQRRQVVIPREMLETFNIQEGDFVAFSQHANGVLIKPKRVVDPDDVLTPAEAKKVRQGTKQIKEGRFKPWRDVKHDLVR